MRPVLTAAEMRAADAVARETVEEAVLIRRAGYAVATEALAMLGGAYGRRVVVLAGKGNNGNDGRVAAGVLSRRGALVRVLDAAGAPPLLEHCDLVIDAAYGTGFAGAYVAPQVAPGTRVLAVDIPSGVGADTGEQSGRALPAERTVTFAALKPGLLLGEGPALCGQVQVADIGVAVGHPAVGLIEDDDVALPARGRESHKWESAVALVAGSPGMEGAAVLSARGAARAGAGMVRLGVPGAGTAPGPWPLEAVRLPLEGEDWAEAVLHELGRCKVLVIGPGLGRSAGTVENVRRLIGGAEVPVVADADALFALGEATSAREVIAARDRPVVLTPHDGEYRRLVGCDPGRDRISAARRLAAETGAVALLKGSLTTVAAPPGGESDPVLLASAGGPVLATAGTGDVLSGIIGAFVARGLDPLHAAGYAAHVHGAAALGGAGEGLVSGDLPDLVAGWLASRTAARG